MIVLIDNYDSFTYNLYQQIGQLGYNVTVIRNDECTIEDLQNMNPELIILSPGPGRPTDAGITLEVIRKLHQTYPILGICLGHQAIGEAFGGDIIRAKTIVHGKFSHLSIVRQAPFFQLAIDYTVMRYHSLVIDKKTLPDCLEILAVAQEDEEIMAVRHKQFPVYGLQFHPESIGTKEGTIMFKHFFSHIF